VLGGVNGVASFITTDELLFSRVGYVSEGFPFYKNNE